jgi:hypothetical protein
MALASANHWKTGKTVWFFNGYGSRLVLTMYSKTAPDTFFLQGWMIINY